jgi:hypothetical protein
VLCEFDSWKPISSTRELQLKGASQRGQELLDTETREYYTDVAATKQRLVKTVTENTSLV